MASVSVSLSLASALASTSARADDDAWSALQKKGLEQEGRKSGDEVVQDRQAERAATERLLEARSPLRFFVTVGVGPLLGPDIPHDSLSAGTFTLTPHGTEGDAQVAPLVGAGLRKGLGGRWELQTRLDATHRSYSPRAFASGTKGSDHYFGEGGDVSASAFLVSADFTTRLRPVSATSSWFVGFGLRATATLGNRSANVDVRPVCSFESSCTGPSLPVSASSPYVQMGLGPVAETGIMLGDDERWELSLRFPLAFNVVGGESDIIFHPHVSAAYAF